MSDPKKGFTPEQSLLLHIQELHHKMEALNTGDHKSFMAQRRILMDEVNSAQAELTRLQSKQARNACLAGSPGR